MSSYSSPADAGDELKYGEKRASDQQDEDDDGEEVEITIDDL